MYISIYSIVIHTQTHIEYYFSEIALGKVCFGSCCKLKDNNQVENKRWRHSSKVK